MIKIQLQRIENSDNALNQLEDIFQLLNYFDTNQTYIDKSLSYVEQEQLFEFTIEFISKLQALNQKFEALKQKNQQVRTS